MSDGDLGSLGAYHVGSCDVTSLCLAYPMIITLLTLRIASLIVPSTFVSLALSGISIAVNINPPVYFLR